MASCWFFGQLNNFLRNLSVKVCGQKISVICSDTSQIMNQLPLVLFVSPVSVLFTSFKLDDQLEVILNKGLWSINSDSKPGPCSRLTNDFTNSLEKNERHGLNWAWIYQNTNCLYRQIWSRCPIWLK